MERTASASNICGLPAQKLRQKGVPIAVLSSVVGVRPTPASFMTFAVLACSILVVCGIIASLQSGRSRTISSLIALQALASAVLLIAYAVADHFTGEGINSAVWYHVRYGLEGAGFGEYRGVIMVTAIALLAVPLIIMWLAFRRRSKSPRVVFIVLGQVFLISGLVLNPGAKDLITLFRTRSPATADFFRHFKPASVTPISSEHPSFVFIFAESLERTYFDERRFPGLITHLRELEREGLAFTNIHTVEGTGFTMGGLVGSLCGVPLFTPANANSMSGMDAFLPGAVGLPDLLHEQGYFLSFMAGASLDFAGKRKFLRTHHFDESLGFSELHGKTQDRTYINNWGLYDDTLFDFAYDRLNQLSQQSRPFGLFLLTLDTHSPVGYLSRSAKAGPYGDGSNPMLNAVKSSDELITRFVRRVQASPKGKNIVVIIVSDHLAMLNAASDRLRQGERSNLFMILDPRSPQSAQIHRPGSTLDVGATVLPTLGFKGRINLGRDLRDPGTAESELLHIQKSETLMSWRPDLLRLWDFPRLTSVFVFEPKSATVKIDDREFQAPVLIELADDGRTTLRFQFDALYESHLAEQATKLPQGKSYLLVVQPDDAPNLVTHPVGQTKAPWVLVAGRAGGPHVTLPLTSEISYSKSQIDRLLDGSVAVAQRAGLQAKPEDESRPSE